MLRLSPGEGFERLDSPLRKFRSVNRTKNSHNSLLSPLGIVLEQIQRIQTAFDVPGANRHRSEELFYSNGLGVIGTHFAVMLRRFAAGAQSQLW